MKPHDQTVTCLLLIFCIHFLPLSIISQSLSLNLYFQENFMVNDKLQDRKWLSAYNRVLCINFIIRVDQVIFLREKFGVSAYSQDWLVAE